MVIFAYIICVLIWGSTWYAIELQLGQVAAEWSVAYRFFFSALVLFAYCVVKRYKLRFNKQQHIWMFMLGFFLFSVNYMLVYIGTGYITSGLVAVTFSMMTVFNIIFARIFLKDAFETTVIIGAISGILGIILIFWPEVEVLNFEDATTIGLTVCLTATVFASLGNTVAGARTTRSVPLFPLTAWGMFYGSLITAVFALIMGIEPTFDDRGSYWLSFLYLSIFGSVIAFSVYLWLIETIGIARASYNTVMTPVVALVISTFLEDFQWTTYAILGVSMVLGGNLMLIIRKSKSEL